MNEEHKKRLAPARCKLCLQLFKTEERVRIVSHFKGKERDEFDARKRKMASKTLAIYHHKCWKKMEKAIEKILKKENFTNAN